MALSVLALTCITIAITSCKKDQPFELGEDVPQEVRTKFSFENDEFNDAAAKFSTNKSSGLVLSQKGGILVFDDLQHFQSTLEAIEALNSTMLKSNVFNALQIDDPGFHYFENLNNFYSLRRDLLVKEETLLSQNLYQLSAPFENTTIHVTSLQTLLTPGNEVIIGNEIIKLAGEYVFRIENQSLTALADLNRELQNNAVGDVYSKVIKRVGVFLPGEVGGVSGDNDILYCNARFTYKRTGNGNGLEVLFLNLSDYSTGAKDVKYHWDFGDGTFSTVKAPTHQYPYKGKFTVRLSISTDANNCINDFVKEISTEGCSANFTWTEVGDKIHVTTLSTDEDGRSENVNGVTWDFGDGKSGSGFNIDHPYSPTGQYKVTSTIQTKGSCVATDVQYVDVTFTGNECCDKRDTDRDKSNSFGPGGESVMKSIFYVNNVGIVGTHRIGGKLKMFRKKSGGSLGRADFSSAEFKGSGNFWREDDSGVDCSVKEDFKIGASGYNRHSIEVHQKSNNAVWLKYKSALGEFAAVRNNVECKDQALIQKDEKTCD